RVLHDAFARQHAATPVHELATKRALVEPQRDAIREPDEHTFLQRFILHVTRFRVEPFAFGDAEEMIEQRADLPRGDGVDAELAAGIEAELVLRRVSPGAHEDPEI